MTSLFHQFKASVRGLLRVPSFTLIAVLTLALAIGANTAVFSVIKVVFLRPLPFAEPGRLVALYTSDLAKRLPGIRYIPASVPHYLDWKARQQCFSSMAASQPGAVTLTGQGEPERVPSLEVTGDWGSTLGIKAPLGRLVGPQDGRDSRVAVLSHGFWKRRFGGDAGLVGQSIVLNGQNTTVVGILPANLTLKTLRGVAEVLTPLVFTPSEIQGSRGLARMEVVARLKPGVNLAQARQSLVGIGRQLQAEYPEDQGAGVDAVPLWEFYYGNQRPLLAMLLLAGALILAIACANVANLMLSRATVRHRETALRRALGGGPIQIMAPFLADALIISLLGAGLGLWLASLGSDLLRPLVPAELLSAYRLDAGVLAFSFTLSILAALICGLIPALLFPHRALSSQLQEGVRGPGHRPWVRSSLVVLQVALALCLSVGFGALWSSLRKLQSAPIGFSTERALTFPLRLNPRKLPDAVQRERVVQGIVEELSGLGGVQSVGTINLRPIVDTAPFSFSFSLPGREGQGAAVAIRLVSPRYFETMKIRVLRGRDFTASDYAPNPNVVVINNSLAEAFWPGEDPIGKQFNHIWMDGSGGQMTIVGVVADVRFQGPAITSNLETIYWPRYHFPEFAATNVVIRTGGNPMGLIPAVREILRRVDPDLPIPQMRTLEDHLESAMAGTRTQATLLGLLAGIALLLSGSGTFGVLAFSVAQRNREIGIRMALGGLPHRVAGDITKQGMALAALGLGMGIVASLFLGRFLASLLYEVSPTNPFVVAAAVMLLGTVSLLASLFPALRAARLDPNRALREE
ncbi:MAG: ABC transporter permease [Acidobacteria bacterium]|nr:ABC transporter permease [Acidobacteriota bacterium]